ncbi:MAG: biotin--[acetyl-CoA-carboxylase] ligase [Candidatus Aceula meridiana]|nr:biotin--[acetyl-CoA-carboxylase] ligase [Candidatus Aceula meridiana]
MNEKIISFLKKADGYFSGEQISKALRISRTAVWKHIKQLKQEGYNIEAVSRRGYRLISAPDKLLPSEIKNGLQAKIFGQKIVYFDTVGSTMDEASVLGFQNEMEGTLVCAESQTKGRGRLGRTWISSKGKGIYFSLILRPVIPVAEAAKLTLLFAISVCQAIRKSTGINAMIKWPNDIMVGKKKISGILTELNAEMDRINFVIVGLGVNVNETKSVLLKSATSIYQEIGKKFSRAVLLKEILEKSEENYLLFQKKGFSPIASQWRSLSDTLGRRVKVDETKKTTEGEAVDIDTDGGLLIRKDDGVVIKKISGDVIHLR